MSALRSTDYRGKIKIDVEGAEEDVLIGAEKTCRKYHPDLIVEFNPPASEKFFGKDMRGVYDQICNLGYQVNFLVRAGGKLVPTLSYDDLLTRIQNQGNIGDIYCTTRLT